MKASKSILFMGTGDIALPSFQALLESEYEVIGLFTQPDRPQGRKQTIIPPKIKEMALEANIPVWQPEKLRGSDELATLIELKADIIVVMAYGQILPQCVMDSAGLACINLHASLLPKYRGASCIQAAIDSGDVETGMTVMHVVKQLDAGDIILQEKLVIDQSSTGGVVHDQLAEIGPQTLLEALTHLYSKDSAQSVPQDDDASSYAPKLLRKDGVIDWSMSALQLERRVRAYDPWPGTSTSYTDAKGKQIRVKVFPQVEVYPDQTGLPGEVLQCDKDGLVVSTSAGALKLKLLQPEGSPKMSAEPFCNGGKLQVGHILG